MRARILLMAAIAVAPASVGACQAPALEDTSTSEHEILSTNNPLPDSTFTGACHMYIVRPVDDDGDPQDDLQCSCSLVAPTIVLTAASCVHDTLAVGRPQDITVTFGTSVLTGDVFGIAAAELHRYYDDKIDGDASALGYEIATLNDEPLTQEHVGAAANIVGYGVSGMNSSDFGTRRKAITPITVVDSRSIFAGIDTVDIEELSCDGDSGGPVFVDLGAGFVQVAVTSLHDQMGIRRCFDNIQRTRVTSSSRTSTGSTETARSTTRATIRPSVAQWIPTAIRARGATACARPTARPATGTARSARSTLAHARATASARRAATASPRWTIRRSPTAPSRVMRPRSVAAPTPPTRR